MSKKNSDLTEKNLATSVKITDGKSGETITIDVHNLKDEYLGIHIEHSSDQDEAYDLITQITTTALMKGLENPYGMFSKEDLQKAANKLNEDIAKGLNFGGSMGEA